MSNRDDQGDAAGGQQKEGEAVSAPAAPKLPMKKKLGKRPFATQIRPSTLGRLEWIRRHGYVLTDTVDAAINAYLDAAGVPPADEHGNVADHS